MIVKNNKIIRTQTLIMIKDSYQQKYKSVQIILQYKPNKIIIIDHVIGILGMYSGKDLSEENLNKCINGLAVMS